MLCNVEQNILEYILVTMPGIHKHYISVGSCQMFPKCSNWASTSCDSIYVYLCLIMLCFKFTVSNCWYVISVVCLAMHVCTGKHSRCWAHVDDTWEHLCPSLRTCESVCRQAKRRCIPYYTDCRHERTDCAHTGSDLCPCLSCSRQYCHGNVCVLG